MNVALPLSIFNVIQNLSHLSLNMVTFSGKLENMTHILQFNNKGMTESFHQQAACKRSPASDQRTAEPKKVVEAIKGSDVRYTATSTPNECRALPKLIGVRRENTEVRNLVTC